MNRYFYSLLLVFLFISCEKSNLTNYPVKEVYVDTTQSFTEFVALLAGSPAGWTFTWTGKDQPTYQGYLTVAEEAESLPIYGDFDLSTFSSFEVDFQFHNTNFKPSFQFKEGTAFTNLLASRGQLDRDFSFLAQTAEGLILSGNEFGNQLYLRPATAAVQANYTTGEFTAQSQQLLQQLGAIEYPYFSVANAANAPVEVLLDLPAKLIQLTRVDDSGLGLQTADAEFVVDGSGVRFLAPITIGDAVYESIQLSGQQLQLVDQQANSFLIGEYTVPVIPLYLSLGRTKNNFILLGQYDDVLPLPTWSESFFDQYYLFLFFIKYYGYNLDLGRITYQFGEAIVNFDVQIYQAGSLFSATYTYDLLRNANGTIKFNNLQTTNANAPLLLEDYLWPGSIGETLGRDNFYVTYRNDGQGNLFAEFTSAENPNFVFTLVSTD